MLLYLFIQELVYTLDDNFITGFVSEYLPGVRISQLGDGFLMSPLWNLIFSRCPFLSWTNNIFGNNYVMEKGKGFSW